jgi:hypothetical protein
MHFQESSVWISLVSFLAVSTLFFTVSSLFNILQA